MAVETRAREAAAADDEGSLRRQSSPRRPAPPSWTQVGKARLASSATDVGDYVVGYLIFVLSRGWSDAIAIYFFGLLPEWFSEEKPIVNSSSNWAVYSLVLVPLTGLCKHLAEDHVEKAEARGVMPVRGANIVPNIMNYIVGWGFAGCAGQFLRELQASARCKDDGGHCLALNLSFTLAWSGAAAVFLSVVKPYVKEIEWGSGKVIDWLEDYVEDVLAMLVRGFTVVTMSLWVTTADEFVFFAVPEGRATTTVTLLYAGTASFAGALLSSKLAQFELSLTPKRGVPPTPRSAVLIEASNLVESALAWISGCAVVRLISRFFPILDASPSPASIGSVLGITVAFSLLCMLWLIVTQGPVKKDDRAAVERYFVTNAMGFFSGTLYWTTGRMIISYVFVAAKSILADHVPDAGIVLGLLMPVSSLLLLKASFALIDFYKRLAGISQDTVLLDAPTDPTLGDPAHVAASKRLAARIIQKAPGTQRARRSAAQRRSSSEESEENAEMEVRAHLRKID